MVQVQGFDHLVLLCTDVAASVAWYRDLLGLEAERVEEWEAGTVFFPSVRIDATTIIDLLPGQPEGRNVDHLCLIVEPSTDLDALVASGEFDVEAGPVEVSGARGTGMSVYVRDPDGHRIELRTYPS